MATVVQLDPQTARVLEDLEGPGVPGIADMSPAEARKWIADFVAKWDLDPPPPIGAVEDFEIPGPETEPGSKIPVRLYRPSAAASDALPIMVFFHAGGYVFGSLDTHESFCRLMAEGAACLVLSVGYRRAPEHKYPAAHEDAYAATLWAARHAGDIGADADRLAVGGDSSGGTLAIAACQMARARGGPAICHQNAVVSGHRRRRRDRLDARSLRRLFSDRRADEMVDGALSERTGGRREPADPAAQDGRLLGPAADFSHDRGVRPEARRQPHVRRPV